MFGMIDVVAGYVLVEALVCFVWYVAGYQVSVRHTEERWSDAVRRKEAHDARPQV